MHKIQKALLKLAEEKNIEDFTLREIGVLVGVDHPQKIKHHLSQLQKKNLLNQSLQTTPKRHVEKISFKNHMMLSIPILGAANCGDATIDASEMLEGYLTVSQSMVPASKKLFAIRAQGPSMNEADIQGKSIDDGDYVIIDAQNKNVRNGDYVLSIINGAANIKKFVLDKANRQVKLLSESSKNISPIFIHLDDNPDYFINGKVVDVIKNQ